MQYSDKKNAVSKCRLIYVFCTYIVILYCQMHFVLVSRHMQLCIVRCSYFPQMKLWEGNVFTPVCDSVHSWVSVQGGLCPGGIFVWGSLSKDVCPGGLCPGDLCQGDPPYHMVKSGWYTSYWNAFLFELVSRDMLFCTVRCILY